MAQNIPEKLIYFLKNALKDVDDGYEYSSELNRILNSDDCQTALSGLEIETLREFAEKVKKIGEINHYSEERVKEIEREIFGNRGVMEFLSADHSKTVDSQFKWPF
jgi:hypothetical protein